MRIFHLSQNPIDHRSVVGRMAQDLIAAGPFTSEREAVRLLQACGYAPIDVMRYAEDAQKIACREIAQLTIALIKAGQPVLRRHDSDPVCEALLRSSLAVLVDRTDAAVAPGFKQRLIARLS